MALVALSTVLHRGLVFHDGDRLPDDVDRDRMLRLGLARECDGKGECGDCDCRKPRQTRTKRRG